ncbi:Eukaryotic translation initiation factor eIF-1 [Friedmanniomyces endolithicus]|nr:Eukaryotic translation initiation factor eIF-1 [Friedmanniomyces endolithicus]
MRRFKAIEKKFACNGTIVHDSEMGEVIQLQGDQRKDVQAFLIDKKEGLELDAKTIKAVALPMAVQAVRALDKTSPARHPTLRVCSVRDGAACKATKCDDEATCDGR